MAMPMDQDDPMGSSAPHADMPSVMDIIQASKATSHWKLFSGNHFIALCHDKGCAACAEYITHLTRGANVGELGPRPSSLSQALDKAWPEAMTCICKDADEQLRDELCKAHRIIEEQTDEIDGLRKDGDKIYADYKVEQACCLEAEESLTHLKGKVKETVGVTTRSSSLSTKRKVDSPPPHAWVAPKLPPEKNTDLETLPPKRIKNNDSLLLIPPEHNPYNPDNWDPDDYYECHRDGHGLAEPVEWGHKKKDDGLHHPEYILVDKQDVPKPPVASLPMSVTGSLPRPLGKAAAKSATRAVRYWFDECGLDDPHLEELYQQSCTMLAKDRLLAQHMAYNCKCHSELKAAKPSAFPMEDMLPTDLQYWISYCSRTTK